MKKDEEKALTKLAFHSTIFLKIKERYLQKNIK